ncbi:MAG: universal stress protein [Enterococcus sp.]
MWKQYQKILVAYDGSEQSKLALRAAFDVAERNKALVILLRVIESGEIGLRFEENADLEETKVRDEMHHEIELAKKYYPELSAAIWVLFGDAKKMIVDLVEKDPKIDLVMIGKTGKGTFAKKLIGSTVSYVVDHARCDVLVVSE